MIGEQTTSATAITINGKQFDLVDDGDFIVVYKNQKHAGSYGMRYTREDIIKKYENELVTQLSLNF